MHANASGNEIEIGIDVCEFTFQPGETEHNGSNKEVPYTMEQKEKEVRVEWAHRGMHHNFKQNGQDRPHGEGEV